MKRLLWWLIAGSRGGKNRARIIQALHDRPYNVNQLSNELNLDYKTVKHHIDVLDKHDIINSSEEKRYGSLYFLSNRMEEKYSIFEEISSKMRKDHK
ncbi:MAG: winged helix-turn-helix domain-containing protein [Methanobacterium sp.]|nr:winged helix-turn-helix domain-containing protein [Methanobacterium sp.]